MENTGPVPIALRPNDQGGIAVERDGVWAGLDLEHHFGIGEIGKSDLAVVTEGLGAEMRPEVHQPVLRLTVDFPKPLALDVIDARLHQLERHARAPELMTDGETFDLGELAKKSHPEAARRFCSDKSDEMRRDQVVAVEFFLDRTILLGKINGRANGGDQHQIVGIACDPDRNRARVRFGRRWGSSAVHLQNSLLGYSMPACSVKRDSRAARSTSNPAATLVLSSTK